MSRRHLHLFQGRNTSEAKTVAVTQIRGVTRDRLPGSHICVSLTHTCVRTRTPLEISGGFPKHSGARAPAPPAVPYLLGAQCPLAEDPIPEDAVAAGKFTSGGAWTQGVCISLQDAGRPRRCPGGWRVMHTQGGRRMKNAHE